MRKIIRSFTFAFDGLVALIRTERNFRIEVVISLVVFGLIFYFPLSTLEIVIVILVMNGVLVMEILNTVLEKLLDMESKRKNKKFKFLKDSMAAAVLLNALVAFITGLLIFGQYLL